MDDTPELRQLFHKLNNQLGIILSHAELLEAKSTEDLNRSRASLVVASVLDAMGTAREIRFRMLAPPLPASAQPARGDRTPL
jgi:hypothetical protein